MADKPRPYSREPARVPLIALGAAACAAIVTGTFTYAYPETLAPIRGELLLAHEIAGDAMLLSGALYLAIHLRRTLRLYKLALSWWTGIGVLTMFAVAGGTGVYGQLRALSASGSLYWAHVVSSIALVAGACFHGANGLRRRLR